MGEGGGISVRDHGVDLCKGSELQFLEVQKKLNL